MNAADIGRMLEVLSAIQVADFMEVLNHRSKPSLQHAVANAGLSILVPCYREEKNISQLLARIVSVMEKTGKEWEAILVDDGSTDSTWEEILKQAGKDSRLKAIRHESNQGIAAAWESAASHASMEWVLTIDADLQFAPEEIPKLIGQMDSGDYDLIQGKRVKRLDSRYRTALSAALSWLLKLLFSLPFDDVKSGFVLYRKDIFLNILSYRRPFRHFENWILVAANSLGCKISQIDITVYPRLAGKTYIRSPLIFGLTILLDIPKLFTKFRLKHPARH